MVWQPIDTAPKDGRLILLRGGSWEDDLGGPFAIGLARWCTLGVGFWLIGSTEAGFNCIGYERPTEWADPTED